MIITPFLVIYSLGYNINLAERRLSNTLSVQIETYPITASVYNNNNNLDSLTPTDIRTSDDRILDIGIKKDDYLDERFLIWGQKNQNTAARITKLWLLPKNGDAITVDNYLSERVNVEILDNIVIWRDGLNFQSLDYTVTGFQGTPKVINNLTSLKSEYSDINFQSIGSEAYFDKKNKLVLLKNQSNWQILDLTQDLITTNKIAAGNPNKTNSVIQAVRSSQDQLLLLNQAGELWLLDITASKWTFLEGAVSGLNYSPSLNSIWIWQKAKIFRLIPGNYETLNLDNFLFGSNIDLVSQDCGQICTLEVKNSFQGILFQIGNNIWLVSDYNHNNWRLIANNVVTTSSNTDTVFWLDTDNQLIAWNFIFSRQYILGRLPDSSSSPKLFYDLSWHRLLIYEANQVSSVWYDSTETNKEILQFSLQTWIPESACLPLITERLQFCLKKGNIVVYRSSNLI